MDGCIEWQGAKTTKGYGQRKIKGRHTRVHRQAWIDEYGPIPAGLFVLHKCDNPPCHNIEHLFLGSAKDNFDDMVAKGRAVFRQPQVQCKRGHSMEDAYIAPGSGNRQCRTCRDIRSKWRRKKKA